MSETDKLRSALTAKRGRAPLNSTTAISTGSTLLNLCCTDDPRFGFSKGSYYFLVGDSTSGKTWLSMTCFAEAARNKSFDDYRFIFDDVEGGAQMNIEHYFGKRVARRLESPSVKDGEAVNSHTVEDFYFNITDAIEGTKPFIYVLDSQDALVSVASMKKFDEHKTASRKGKDSAGSYGDGKAKYHSENIRHVLSGLRKTKSILIIIGQTRDNLGFGFEQKTRSGGKSLKFYASLELWSSVAGKIKKTVRGKDRTIGITCQVEVKKNRITGKTGKDRSIKMPIHYDLGIDDVGACVDFLVNEKHWTKPSKGSVITADDFKFKGIRAKLIAHIEDNNLETQLKKITGRVWREIEEESKTKRKPRYE